MKGAAAIVVFGSILGGAIGWVLPAIGNRPVETEEEGTPVVVQNATEGADAASVASLIEAIAGELGDPSDWKAKLRAWRLVETMTPEQVRHCAETLLGERGRFPRNESVLRMLLERWAFLDPEQFLDRADILDRTNRTGLLGSPCQQAFHHLAKRDIRLAIERFGKLTSPLRARNAGYMIADVLLRNDPAGFADFAGHTGSYRNQLEELARSNAALMDAKATEGTADPAQALEAARQLPEGNRRWNAYDNVATALIDEDPERAIGILDEIPPGRRRSAMLAGLAYRWAMVDSDSAVKWALTLTNPAEQTEVFGRMVWSLTRDRDLALAVIDAIPGSGKREEVFALFVGSHESWEPTELISFAESLEQPRRHYLAVNEWVRQVSEDRADTVAGYIAESARPSERDALIGTWSKNIRLPEAPEEQLRLLGESLANVPEAQQQPFLDALLKNRGKELVALPRRSGSATFPR